MKERQWSEELMAHEVENVRPPTVSGGEKKERYKSSKIGNSVSRYPIHDQWVDQKGKKAML